MSLLHEARENFRKWDKRHEELERERLKREPEELVENILPSQMRSQCAELLRQYGEDVPEPSKGILGKAKTIFQHRRKFLSVALAENDEKPVNVTIESEYSVPEKGYIAIKIQTLDTFLILPKIGKGVLRDFHRKPEKGLFDSHLYPHQSSEGLRQYQEVLNIFEEQLNPQGSQPS